ncbi:hypothetical protein WJX79_001234 [Trebouxia sp. C0005]
MASNSEHKSELRLRTRTTLDNLEVKDLCNQSSIGLQRTCDRCSTPADLCLVLKETLSGLSSANTQARRLRYKAAAAAISQRAAGWVGPSVPSLVKHVLDRIGQEEHQSNQEELAGLLKALAVAAVAYNAGHEGQQKEDDWFGKLLTEPLLRAAASGPSKQRVASGCTMVHAVLTAVLEWANYPPVISASVDCLRTTLSYLNTGLLVPRVPEVFLPLKQCIEILGANLQPRSAQAILDQCLQGIMQKEDWQMRRQAVETFITLAAAVQVHKPSEGGQWHLEHTPCIEVLVKNKTAILNALTDAKHGGDALEEDVDERVSAPSPRSDMGAALEPEQDDGDSPKGAPTQGRATQPLRDSLQTKQGSRRHWAGNASASLNRSSAGGKGSSRTPLSHVSGSTGLGKTAPPAGSSVKQRKENLTPARPRHSFVKPKKQVFADFGVQVFAPLPRAISPEREVPKPSIPDEEDNSPVGPLKVQLPDLTRDSDQDRVTVLTESQPHGHSEQLLLASAESSEEYDQQAGASAVPTTGSKEHTQEAEGVAKSGKAAELSAHTGRHEANERAETKPDVHVDKPAGIISITRLPPGSSIRLVGLQHSLYEHPVKVEILAPSARGMDHFSYSLAGPYQQEEGVYQMYEGQTLQQHPSSAGSRPPQWQDDAWHPEASGGLEAVMRPPGSVQGSAQGDVGMAPVLSGASSGFSSPLRESGHLESLLEVNSRVEAAMDRARAQLQGRGSSGWPANDASHDSVSRQSQGDTPSQAKRGPQESQSQRAKPRGLPSTVQSTVDRIAANTGPSAAVSAEISSESSSAMFAHAEATEEEEQVAAVCYEAGSGPTSPDTALVGTVAQGNSTGSLTRCPRGQGKPPLSPVRQSLQDLVLSHDSSPSEHALMSLRAIMQQHAEELEDS